MARKSNKSGNALLIVSGIALAVGIASWALQSYLPTLSQQSVKSADLIHYKLALESALDYAAINVKHRECLDGKMLPTQPCELNDPQNTGRLILDDRAAAYVESQFGSDARLSEIEIEVSKDEFEDFSTFHPLYYPFKNLPANVEKITWTLSNLKDDLNFSTTSNQVFIRIRVELELESDGLSARALLRKENLFVEGLFGFYRRELGSMALIVANDLRLDRQLFSMAGMSGSGTYSYPSSDAGNAYIPFANSKDLAGNGVIFKSPIFVNRNVVLPSRNLTEKPTPVFSNVTFSDKIYLGDGRIEQDGLAYSPKQKRNGELSTYAGIDFLGGIFGGVVIDGEPDLGLDYFVGKGPLTPGTVDMSLVKNCTERANKLRDLAQTEASRLLIQLQPGGSADELTFRVGLSHENEFIEQTGMAESRFDTATTTGDWSSNSVNVDGEVFPIAKVELVVDDTHTGPAPSIQVEMTRKTTLEATPNVQDYWEEAHDAAIDALQTALNDAGLTSVATIDTKISNLQGDIAALNLPSFTSAFETKLNTQTSPVTPIANFLPDPDNPDDSVCDNHPDLVSGLSPSEVQDFKQACGDYRDAKRSELDLQKKITKIQNKRGELEALDAKINSLAAKKTSLALNQPKIEMSADGTKVDDKLQPNQFDLKIKTTNGSYLPSPLKINLTGYDIGTDRNGNFTRGRTSSDNSLKSTITLVFDESAGEFVPDTTLQSNNWLLGDLSLDPISEGIIEDKDYSELARSCGALGDSVSGAAFASADWDVSYTRTTRKSWIFADPHPYDKNYPDDPNKSISSTHWQPNDNDAVSIQDVGEFSIPFNAFGTRSIVNVCRIPKEKSGSPVKLVTGFYACDSLIIESRTEPLEIIGSFIVGHMRIHPEAVKAGVTFSSIYHPESIQVLRQRGVLKPEFGSNCESIPEDPIWHPFPSLQNLSNVFRCTPVSLRAKADNWSWTQVDPEQGFAFDPSSGTFDSVSTEKPIPKRFIVKEISRQSNL